MTISGEDKRWIYIDHNHDIFLVNPDHAFLHFLRIPNHNSFKFIFLYLTFPKQIKVQIN